MRKHFCTCRSPAHAHRHFRRTHALLTKIAEVVLHNPVFKRMERDHTKLASRSKHVERVVNRFREPFELTVHCNAQRLERPCSRMDWTKPVLRWNSFVYDVGKRLRGNNASPLARLHDC